MRFGKRAPRAAVRTINNLERPAMLHPFRCSTIYCIAKFGWWESGWTRKFMTGLFGARRPQDLLRRPRHRSGCYMMGSASPNGRRSRRRHGGRRSSRFAAACERAEPGAADLLHDVQQVFQRTSGRCSSGRKTAAYGN
jgi:hypothetical protein